MSDRVTSADGTTIVFDRLGDGPPLVVVSGMFCDRRRTADLADQLYRLLVDHFCVVNYDRRGRGDSGDTAPYAVERELEDLDALITATGGQATVYGHSSGAGLALRAAAHGLPITRLVLHEPPYGPDDPDSRQAARQLAERVRAAIADGCHADAITCFMNESGAPPEIVQTMSTDPAMLALAPTMPYDHDVMGDFDRGGTIPVELVGAVNVPTLVLAGGTSPDFFQDTTTRIARLLPNGTLTVLEGHDHAAPAAAVAPVVARFLLSTD